MFVQFVETHLWRTSKESTLMFFSELKLSPVSTAIKICVMISIIFETYFQNKTTLPASFPLYSWKSIKIDDNAPFSNQSTIVFSFACLAFSLTCIHCLLLQSASTLFFSGTNASSMMPLNTVKAVKSSLKRKQTLQLKSAKI